MHSDCSRGSSGAGFPAISAQSPCTPPQVLLLLPPLLLSPSPSTWSSVLPSRLAQASTLVVSSPHATPRSAMLAASRSIALFSNCLRALRSEGPRSALPPPTHSADTRCAQRPPPPNAPRAVPAPA